MIRPATPADLASITPAPGEAQGWLEILANQDLGKIIAENRVHVVEHQGHPVLAFGVGRLRLCASEVPWIWAVVDESMRGAKWHVLRRQKKIALETLASITDGGYTAPEKLDPSYERFLRFLGFEHLGWGLWRWRSSALR